MPAPLQTNLSVAIDGKQFRVPIANVVNLDDLKQRIQSATGGRVAELRCGKTGIIIRSLDDIASGDDSLIAYKDVSPQTEVDDDPSVPVEVLEIATSFARSPMQYSVLGPAQSFAASCTALFVAAVPPKDAPITLVQASGKRFILHVGHRVVRADEADPGGALAADWAMSIQHLGAHPNVLTPLFYSIAAPPPDVAQHLPAAVKSALAAAGQAGRLQMLLTEPYIPVPKGVRQPIGVLFGMAVDLCRALVRVRGAGVVHRGVRPDVCLQSTTPGNRLLLAGWEHAVTVHDKGATTGGALIIPTAGANQPLFLLGPAPEYAAPEVHAAVAAVASGRASAVTYDKADVWSAGTTLAALAGGQHPWVNVYPTGAADFLGPLGQAAGLRAPVCPPANLVTLLGASVPPAFLALLHYMTRADPAQRITARAALHRLLELANGHPTASIPPAAPQGTVVAGAARFALPGAVIGAAPTASNTASAMAEDAQDETVAGRGRAGGGKEGDDDEGGRGGQTEGGMLILQVTGADGRPPMDRPCPVAIVPFAAHDSDTVSVLISRACEQLDTPDSATGMSLVWEGQRVDPMAPVHRLPAPLRNAARTGRVVGLAPDLTSTSPTVLVEGYGMAGLPTPPNAGPVSYALPAPPAAGPAGYMGYPAQAGAAVAAVRPAAGVQMAVEDQRAAPAAAAAAAAPAAVVQAPTGVRSTEPDPLANACFSPAKKGPAMELMDGCTVAMTRGQWGCVGVHNVVVGPQGYVPPSGSHLRPTCNKYTMSVTIQHLDNGAGCAVGFYEASKFDPTKDFFGHTPGGWAYSRSGKISDGRSGWVEYGESYGAGDVITVDLDWATERPHMKFYKNGIHQGTAYGYADLLPKMEGGQAPTPPLFVPAVTMGSNTGGKTVKVGLSMPEIREFDVQRTHYRIQFSEDRSVVWNSGKWATVLLSHPGLRSGKLSWNVRLDDTKHGAGVAVGVVDVATFKWSTQNLGASPGSWCYSKTGKKGDGSGSFQTYGKPFSSGDTINVTLDLDAKTLTFAVNGESQQVAYNASNGIGAPGQVLVPAVCLGSTEGDKLAMASITGPYPTVRRFSPFYCNPKITLVDNCSAAETREKWGTVFADYPAIRGGKFSFAVQVTSAGQGCGAGIGFALADALDGQGPKPPQPPAQAGSAVPAQLFEPRHRNLGAHAGSWCYSKTGKFAGNLSSMPSFESFASSFKTGDIITAEVDCDKEEMRFYLNGKEVGPQQQSADGRVSVIPRRCENLRAALHDPFKRVGLRPAVVLGSSEGGHYTKLTIAPPAVTRFDPQRKNKHMELEQDDRKVATEFRWCTAMADHPGVQVGGILRFAVKLEGEGGAAIGFAEANTVKVYAQNLGPSPGTWAISKTGKVSKGDAEAFVPFSEKFGPNDVIGAEADLVDGIIRFWKNGNLLGTAFSGLLQAQEAEWMPKPVRPLTLVPAVCLGSNQGGKASAATFVEFQLDWLR